jgi:hypothetical protein
MRGKTVLNPLSIASWLGAAKDSARRRLIGRSR